MKAIRTGILSIVITFGAITALNAQNADKILGVYRALGVDTQIWSEVQFTKHGDCYEGNVIWVENKTDGNGNPLVDANNPDPKLRNPPANKIKVIWGVKYDPKKDIWTDG